MAKNNLNNINSKKKDTGVNEGAALSEIEHGKNTVKNKLPVSKQEQESRKENLKTQGVKDCKLPRINMAFTPANHDFIRIMSRATGLSMTEVINNIIAQYRAEHGDLYEKAADVYREFMGDSEK